MHVHGLISQTNIISPSNSYHELLSCSSEVVFSSLLFEKIKLLKGLQSVNGEIEIRVGWHSKSVGSVLNLHVIEDHASNVVSVLFGQGFIRGGVNLGNESVGVSENGSTCFGNEFSGVVVSCSLGEGNTE